MFLKIIIGLAIFIAIFIFALMTLVYLMTDDSK